RPGAVCAGGRRAEVVAPSHNADRIEKLVQPRLTQIARAFPHLVQHARASGYAFAFDLPSAAHLDAFINQRFWRGAVVFGAGTKTARYRLSDSFLAREIDMLFDTVRRSLSWLDAHDGKKPPAWEDAEVAARPAPAKSELRYRLRPPDQAARPPPRVPAHQEPSHTPAPRPPPPAHPPPGH